MSADPASMALRCTVVIINFQTPDLLRTAVTSFRSFYPSVPLCIVDNGSQDASRTAVEELCAASPPATAAIFLPRNIFHGPAMDHAMRAATTEFVFFLDSDTRTLRGGFLERMIEAMDSSPESYAAGHVDRVTRRGFLSPNGTITAVRTPFMLIERRKYLKCAPFLHHGLPTVRNFADATRRHFRFHDFPIEEYIEHFGRGTSGRFGYQLGLRSKIDYLLNKLGW